MRAVAVYLMVGRHTGRQGSRPALPGMRGTCLHGLVGRPGQQAAGAFVFPFRAAGSAHAAADVLHADETGSPYRVPAIGPTSPAPAMLTLLDCHPKRGKEAFADMAVPAVLLGRADHRRVEAVLVDPTA